MQQGENGSDVRHFRTLFEVPPEDDVVKNMNQVFLFVHEMKGLLQVLFTQFGRDVLGIDSETSIQVLIEQMKYKLQV